MGDKMKTVAVVGCGYWGKNLIRNFYELDSLLAICDTNKKSLDLFHTKYPDSLAYDNYQTLLENKDIKAVAIATPASTHYELAKQAILAEKDVFVEKPIALKYENGKDLVSLAENKSKILMVGHILEYHPAIVKLRELIGKGKIGKINYIYSNRLNLGKFRNEENILWSFAPHDLSVILGVVDEMPKDVSAYGGNYLNPDITDITVTTMSFPSGAKAHIFVSWLHPYKEQKLVVIGDKAMAVFDDVDPKNKLYMYNHKIDWIERLPVPRPEKAESIPVEPVEPLKAECKHFLDCMATRKPPRTDGASGLRVLKILELCQESLKKRGVVQHLDEGPKRSYFVHETSVIDENVEIGEHTKIWHFSHVLKNSRIGDRCNIGQNVVIGPNVKIGNNVKIQNNVSVYDGVTLEDDVFCGPSMVFTNVLNPRSHWPRKDEYRETLVKKGTSLGANSTIVCGTKIGRYAFIGAGALVTKDIPDYALAYGVPAKIMGWTCYCGQKLPFSKSSDSNEKKSCKHCSRKYVKKGNEVLEISERENE